MKKMENFERTLKNLKDIYDYEEPYENVVLTGLVALDIVMLTKRQYVEMFDVLCRTLKEDWL